MMLTHLISFLQFSLLLCLIPVTSYSNDIKSILLNLLLIPFNYFIAYVYYKKALFLIKGTVSLLRWSFLVLYCFLIIFVILVGALDEKKWFSDLLCVILYSLFFTRFTFKLYIKK